MRPTEDDGWVIVENLDEQGTTEFNPQLFTGEQEF
jgi:hypothetical protein